MDAYLYSMPPLPAAIACLVSNPPTVVCHPLEPFEISFHIEAHRSSGSPATSVSVIPGCSSTMLFRDVEGIEVLACFGIRTKRVSSGEGRPGCSGRPS